MRSREDRKRDAIPPREPVGVSNPESADHSTISQYLMADLFTTFPPRNPNW